MVFGKRKVVNFYLKMLVGIEIEELPEEFQGSHIGWLEKDEGNTWYDKIRLFALGLILLFIPIEWKKRSSYSARPMTEDLNKVGFSCKGWPTFFEFNDYSGLISKGVTNPHLDYV